MMGAEFKRGIYGAFERAGFAKQGYALQVPGDGATTLVDAQKGFGDQWFINAGFCPHRLASEPADRVEKAHMYFRLERLFPEHQVLILDAGALEDPRQPGAYPLLLELLAGDIGAGLRALGTEQAIIEAYRMGRLNQGLVLGIAREMILPSA